MNFSSQVVVGLCLGAAAGLFLGEFVEPLRFVADGFVNLLQMTVLPYVVLSIVTNLGQLTYTSAKSLGLRAGATMALLWTAAIIYALLLPFSFPRIESASFYSPPAADAETAVSFIQLFVPKNPFDSLAHNAVPAVVVFSVLLGLALIGVERKEPLLTALSAAASAVARLARFVVRLTPYGIFAIVAVAAGTLNLGQVQRIEVYLIAYIVFALLLSLWVLPGLISAITPIRVRDSLAYPKDAFLTAFLVGDLFIVLPALIEASSRLLNNRLVTDSSASELPGTVAPVSFTFPHSGKLLSLSFVLFAAWFTDTAVPVLKYFQLALSGFFSLFGSMNVAIPFLLDSLRIPVDTFQLFLITGVINSRFGTLLAAVHTFAVCLLTSAAIAGAVRFQPRRIARFLLITAVATLSAIAVMRLSFTQFIDFRFTGARIVNSMAPLNGDPFPDSAVLAPADVPGESIPSPDNVLDKILSRNVLRVGLISEGIPFAFRNSRGELVGFDIEMAQRLARDLAVDIEFVRFRQEELATHVQARLIDIVMTGARVTPERAAEFVVSEPYLDETLAVITLDYNRQKFQSWDAIRAMGNVRIGVQNLPYYVGTIQALLPEARLEIIPETTQLIDADAPYAAYILPSERGSVLTMLNPRLSVVVPTGATIKMPLAYPIAGNDPRWIRFVNTWIALKQRDGFVASLYDHWILGKTAIPREPRWSIIRNVLHWVD